MLGSVAELMGMEVAEKVIDAEAEARDRWLEERRGKITASNFQKLISTGRKSEPFSQTGFSYLHMVIAERLGSFYEADARSLAWGREQERPAIEVYADRLGVLVDSTPYRYIAFNSDIGGTPDGLVGDDGCIEVKCPYNPATHVNTLISKAVPSDYVAQVDGHLLVTGRQWCDFISFDPRMDGQEQMAVVRVARDEKRIAFLRDRLLAAAEYVTETTARIAGGSAS